MQYQFLGRTGMKVSRICLGAASFGGGGIDYGDWGCVPEKEAHILCDMALEMGINFFDVADAYGSHGVGGHCGLSEEILGTWFTKGGGRREKVILATKMGHVMIQDEYEGPNKPQNLSLYKIRRHFKESLKRLQTDHVELYLMHDLDRRTTWDEIWEAFEGLVRSGRADYIGSSNGAAWQIMKGNEAARRRGFMGIVNEQHCYNLLRRQAELEVIPMAKDQGVGLTLFSPLFRGTLGVDLLSPEKRPLSPHAARVVERYRPQLLEFARLCHDLGEEPATVAVAWELANPAVDSVIIGACTPKDLTELVRAAEIKLNDSTMKRLDEIFPGPGGEAPHAYEGWNELMG